MGVALVAQWAFTAAAACTGHCCPGCELLRSHAIKAARFSQSVMGYIESPIAEVGALQAVVQLDDRSPRVLLRELGDASVMRRVPNAPVTPKSCPLRILIQEWEAHPPSQKPVLYLPMAPAAAHCIVTGSWCMLNSVAFTSRLNRKLLLQPRWPTPKTANMLRRSIEHLSPVRHESLMVWRRPKWFDSMTDPFVVLDWLEASGYLKDSKKNQEAIPHLR